MRNVRPRVQGVRGAPDILPEQSAAWQRVEVRCRRLLAAYGYTEIRTPVFERTELFIRAIGEGTDIVEKEMYTFTDKGGESLTLRPEATAAVVRAVHEHNLLSEGRPVKVYYIGPMFRRERPQSGRFRQFHQIGVEAIGVQGPGVDAEMLALLLHLFEEWGLPDLELHLNSIGDPLCRPSYVERLTGFLRSRKAKLCRDCQGRLGRNPLRVLDCKNPGCRAVTAHAPKSIDFLCDPCADHFRGLRELLDALDVKYELDPRLVRGLDYYTRTAFELVNPALGAQNAVAGGGRYDGLAKEIGGKAIPGIGFAIGLERVVTSLEARGRQGGEAPAAQSLEGAFVATVGRDAFKEGLLLVQKLRRADVRTGLDLRGEGDRSLRSQLREADKKRYRFVVILGEDELEKREVTLKDMKGGGQESIPLGEVVDRLARAKQGEPC
ncbi:MAG: histidine--tRNA ligase [Candidatus Methylomirabilales bacterium]